MKVDVEGMPTFPIREKVGLLPQLGINPDGMVAQFAADHLVSVQRLWRDIGALAKEKNVSDIRHDYSEGDRILLAGRVILPGVGLPIYWAVQDNRVFFSYPLDKLNKRDSMLLANQVLISYAGRSQKDDLKSAALAISERGQCYIALNTQELDTMKWDRQCAESNLTRLVLHFLGAQEKVAHMYILGGLSDGKGGMQLKDQLIGMCMRCVETVYSVMGLGSMVTVIPANNGASRIKLDHSSHMNNVDPGYAWQVPYDLIKRPSIIQFSDEVNQYQQQAFNAMRTGALRPEALLKPLSYISRHKLRSGAVKGNVGIPLLDANEQKITPQAINAFMVAQLAKQAQAVDGKVTQMAIAVVEITENGKKRYEYGMELDGDYNSQVSPVSAAVTHSGLSIPRKMEPPHISPHVSNVYVMGYNADGSPYNWNAEQWDRALKRAGGGNPHGAKVHAIPLNDGKKYPADDVQSNDLLDFVRTDFSGSKQPNGSRQMRQEKAKKEAKKEAKGCCPGH